MVDYLSRKKTNKMNLQSAWLCRTPYTFKYKNECQLCSL